MPKIKTGGDAAEAIAILQIWTEAGACQTPIKQLADRRRALADAARFWTQARNAKERAAAKRLKAADRKRHNEEADQWSRWAAAQENLAEKLRQFVVEYQREIGRAAALVARISPALVEALPSNSFFEEPSPDPERMAAKFRRVVAELRTMTSGRTGQRNGQTKKTLAMLPRNDNVTKLAADINRKYKKGRNTFEEIALKFTKGDTKTASNLLRQLQPSRYGHLITVTDN